MSSTAFAEYRSDTGHVAEDSPEYGAPRVAPFRQRKLHVDVELIKAVGEVAANVYSRIDFWFNSKDIHGKTRLRVQIAGKLWLAKSCKEMAEEVGSTRDKVDKAIRLLRKRGMIQTIVRKFAGKRCLHFRPLAPGEIALATSRRKSPSPKNRANLDPSQPTETTEKSTGDLDHSQLPKSPIGEIPNRQMAISLHYETKNNRDLELVNMEDSSVSDTPPNPHKVGESEFRSRSENEDRQERKEQHVNSIKPIMLALITKIQQRATTEGQEMKQEPVVTSPKISAGPPISSAPRRANGTNLRAVGKNPRALKTNPIAIEEAQIQEKRWERDYRWRKQLGMQEYDKPWERRR